MTENRRLEMAAPAMNARMMTLNNARVFFVFAFIPWTGGLEDVTTAMAGSVEKAA